MQRTRKKNDRNGNQKKVTFSYKRKSPKSLTLHADILTYEDVTLHLQSSRRKRPIVLVGASNVGCLELRARLMETKEKFCGVVPRKFVYLKLSLLLTRKQHAKVTKRRE